IIDKEIAELKEKTGVKSSRLSSLREFQEGYEWCNEGTRHIMKTKKQEGFHGLVADYIEVPKEYEAAVEAVLGEKLQHIVVKTQEDGIRAIDYLKTQSLGRGSFIPVEVRTRLSGVETLYGDNVEIVRLSDVVNVEKGFEDIADYLLGNVLLIPNLNTGISLWRRNGFEGTFVTPEGDIICPHGVLTGGNGGNGENSLLRNKREIAELEEEIDKLIRSLKDEEESRVRTTTLISQCEEELVELRAELRSLELGINGRRKDIERFEGEQEWIEQRINVLAFNMESMESEEAQTIEKIAAAEKDILSHKNRKEEVNETISSLQERWEELRNKLEEMERELTDEKVLLASLEEKKNASLKTLASLNTAATDISNDIDSKTGETEDIERKIKDITRNIALKRDHLDHLYSDHDTCEAELEKKREFQNEKGEVLRGREMEDRKTKEDLDNLTKEASELEMESREVSFQINTLQEGIYGKYHVDLNSLETKVEKLEETDIQELRNKLDRDRKSIENFGEVNLLALSEHEKLKERYDFLTSQAEDLNSSLDMLQRTISRINGVSRKRFAETFTAVNECFKDVFSRLFQGGKGELRLTDETDMLETGVDIDIQLPGKKPQNITLLSGGEKSLAAVALIFSILLYRPTPFLVLDEVDAALDDANISLFNKLLKDISANSQVILVTHNKRTMEFADNLHGVTMEKQGISTMVSVSLH
ncbi:MAG: chromosome segregation protein SMC, partial [Proteobacteria bacterium]|nr:chromosome segregation protein SMC [Pseudomonadota bacterium]